MKTTLIFVRHGECEGNRVGLFRGRIDFPLNKNGIKQAELLRDEIKKFKINAIYTSPLLRALKTAEIIGEPHNLTPIVEEGFNNISLSFWEGRVKTEIEKEYPREWKIWITVPEDLNIPGAEKVDDVKERAFSALLKILEKHERETIAIVTHRAVLKPLFAAMFEVKKPYFWKFHFDTASYSIVEYRRERGFTLVLLNETKHLIDFVVEEV
ncbi:MAG: histidine phosphatase family protein [Synergistetes bacterium]|nr:histidine phosphatase family protein [Synergistota bacterium]MCX8127710.1 histidine phosphatase family protein [Synergistota bacterium]MDW8191375.1 histidine phosphatase family protein [Synergistota bacterium]